MNGPLVSLGADAGACVDGVCAIPEAAPKLTLISFPTCPYVQRAVIALRERGVEYEVIHIDLANKPDWFLEISPLGKVPVLKIERAGEKPVILFESTVILQYLDETLLGQRLFPEDALDRARQRAWVEYAGSVLGELWKLGQAKDEAGFAEARTGLITRLQPLEAEVVGPFFAGAGFSAVDAVFAPAFRQLDALETVRKLGVTDDLPKLQAWRQALAARPSVAGAVPADFLDLYLGRLRAAASYALTAN
ncbi:glutathione S-transferase family protein [uncultured Paracoccus sp.]|uniref:glutathione S-transferase family protein n=1 Tax=uncultured Paracoccus sp. TaxID=189685 RepID=UPI00261377C3|nr:glutathione S-transferase family protein [uncultured Paracoccus sp.]